METTDQVNKEVTLTRTLDAPRELVFKAWTDAEHMKQWWGPHRFTNPVCEIDARPGGAILIHMQGPDGTVYPMTGVFKEVVKPERLVFTSSALDDDGTPLFENMNTITFAADGNKTILTVHTKVDKVANEEKVAPMLAGMNEGWSQSLERLYDLVVKM
jgi:uncharacterized protein YndB with AHSA1/START domain